MPRTQPFLAARTSLKKRILLITGSLVYTGIYFLLYYRYVPRIEALQWVLFPVLCFVLVCTSISLRTGTLSFIVLIPVSSSLPHFFNLSGVNPLLFIFYAYILGFLIHQIRCPSRLQIKNPLFYPVLGASVVLILSALITFWRYTNFFPLFSASIHELAVNVLAVSSGEAMRRVLFDSLNYFAGFIWFILIVNVLKDRKTIQNAVFYLAVSATFSFLFGFYQAYKNIELGNTSFFVSFERINALFTDPNALGVFVSLTVPLFLGALLAFDKARKPLFVFVVLAAVLLLPHAGSRTGFLGLVLGIVFLAALGAKVFGRTPIKKLNGLKKPWVFIPALLLGAVCVVLSLMALKEGTLAKRFTKDIGLLSKAGGEIEILQGRHLFWSASHHMIKDYPFSGIGIGAYTCELPNFYKKYGMVRILPFSYYQRAASHDIYIDSAGSFYLHVGSELGLIGLFFFVWIFYLILKRIFLSHFKKGQEPEPGYLNAGISSGILAMFVIFLFGAHTLSFEIQMVFWMMAGLLFAISPSRKNDLRLRRLKGITVCLCIGIFAAFHAWNSFHDLSLQKRTRIFGLPQEFGFYQSENMEGREFRWTAKKAGLTVRIKKPFLVIPVLASHPDIKKNPVKVNIFISENLLKEKRLLDEIVLKESSWQEFRFDLSRAVGGDVLFSFEVSRTWKPSELLGTSDSRDLGIAVGTWQFREISSAKPEERLVRRSGPSDWEGPQRSNLYENGRCWIETSLPEGDVLFKICAKGQEFKNEWPYMIVWLNDEMMGGEWVSSDIWTYYSFEKKIKSGRYKISAEFINESEIERSDKSRALFVGNLEIILRE